MCSSLANASFPSLFSKFSWKFVQTLFSEIPHRILELKRDLHPHEHKTLLNWSKLFSSLFTDLFSHLVLITYCILDIAVCICHKLVEVRRQVYDTKPGTWLLLHSSFTFLI